MWLYRKFFLFISSLQLPIFKYLILNTTSLLRSTAVLLLSNISVFISIIRVHFYLLVVLLSNVFYKFI